MGRSSRVSCMHTCRIGRAGSNGSATLLVITRATLTIQGLAALILTCTMVPMGAHAVVIVAVRELHCCCRLRNAPDKCRMTIPEEQLKTWSNQGGTGNSITAHTAIRNALQAADSPLTGKTFEIFLQGSYRNSTNIRADSDVDVVAQITQGWYKDLAQLTPEQRAAYERTFFPGTYTAVNWRKNVEAVLRKKFGNALKADGRKPLPV